jgi:hypothetical protein
VSSKNSQCQQRFARLLAIFASACLREFQPESVHLSACRFPASRDRAIHVDQCYGVFRNNLFKIPFQQLTHSSRAACRIDPNALVYTDIQGAASKSS